MTSSSMFYISEAIGCEGELSLDIILSTKFKLFVTVLDFILLSI